MKHLWQQQLCDRQPQPQQSYVSLFLFLALLWCRIQSARVSVYLSTTGPALFPISPKALGSSLYSTLRRHSLLAGRAAPRARLLSWWNQWEIYSQFQQLRDQPSSTMQQRQQRIQSNAQQRGCANICNRSKTWLRRWTLVFFFPFFFPSSFSLNECHRLFFSNSVFPLEGRDLSALKESY